MLSSCYVMLRCFERLGVAGPRELALLGWARARSRLLGPVKLSSRPHLWLPLKSVFAGFRFPAEVIMVGVRWYLRYGLSYREVEKTAGRARYRG
jgi:hypothetical protein